MCYTIVSDGHSMSRKNLKFRSHYSKSPYKYIGTRVAVKNIHKYLIERIDGDGIHSVEPRDGVCTICAICGVRQGLAWHNINNYYYFVCSLYCEQNLTMGEKLIKVNLKNRLYHKIPAILSICVLFGILSAIGCFLLL